MHYLYSKDGFTYGHPIQYKMLLVRLHVYRSVKLKAYKLFESSDADLSGFFFEEASLSRTGPVQPLHTPRHSAHIN